jgi:hypothetical protein
MKQSIFLFTFFLISLFLFNACNEDGIDKGPDRTENNTVVPPSNYCQPILDYVAANYPSTVTIDSVLQIFFTIPGTPSAQEVFEVHLSIGAYLYFSASDCTYLTTNCNCPTTYDPVCWNGQDYQNECIAICSGAVVSEIQQGTCPPCGCPTVFDPVCYNGQTYDNECLAQCAGAQNYQIFPGECNGLCIASAIQAMYGGVNYHVLSVTTNALGNYSVVIEFGPNSILNVQFDPNCGYISNCGCSGAFNPVCSNFTNYQNECEALCAGVLQSSITAGFCN